MRAAIALVLPSVISGCFALDSQAPDATREQIEQFLEACAIDGAKIEVGNPDYQTDWAISMGEQPQAKWDCLSEQMQRAGVLATTGGSITELTNAQTH